MLGLGLSLTGGAVTRGGVSPSLDLDFMAGTMPAAVTFTRASAATYFDSAGVLRTQGYNLLLRSEEFDHAAWSKGASSIQINAGADPFGGNGADKLVENGASAFHYTNQTVVKAANALVYTYSVYIKDAGNGRQVSVTMEAGGSNGASMRVDPATGVITSAALRYGTFTSASGSIASVGNGWHRAMISATTGTEAFIAAQCSLHNGTNSIYQGDGSSGALLWGAMLEQSSTLSGYSPTTSAANGGPRFDHDPGTLAPRGLLVEEARTNIFPATINGATFTKQGSSTATDVAGITTPFGTTDSVVQVSGAPDFSNRVERFFSAVAADATVQFTSSVFIRAVTGTAAGTLRCSDGSGFDGVNNFSVGTTWTRVAASQAAGTQTGTNRLWRLYGLNAAVYIAAPQMEAGAFATSYITGGATRAADTAVIGTLTPWFNAAEGAMLAEFDLTRSPPPATQYAIAFDDGTASNMMALYVDSIAQCLGFITAGLVTQAQMLGASGIGGGTVVKAAMAYKINDAALAVNGAAAVADATVTIPTVTKFNIGNRSDGARQFSGHIRKIRYWRVRRPNSDLQQITAI